MWRFPHILQPYKASRLGSLPPCGCFIIYIADSCCSTHVNINPEIQSGRYSRQTSAGSSAQPRGALSGAVKPAACWSSPQAREQVCQVTGIQRLAQLWGGGPLRPSTLPLYSELLNHLVPPEFLGSCPHAWTVPWGTTAPVPRSSEECHAFGVFSACPLHVCVNRN